MKLQKINNKLYTYLNSNMLFTLKYGDNGVLGYGKAWYLSFTFDGVKQPIYTFIVKNDGYHTCELYINMYDILEEAEKMINKIINS